MGAEMTEILIMLGIGAVAGWLAGIIMKGAGFGLSDGRFPAYWHLGRDGASGHHPADAKTAGRGANG